MTEPGDAKVDEQGERAKHLVALQDEIAAAAEAAAASAASAVAATRAIEEISKTREEAEAKAATAVESQSAKGIATDAEAEPSVLTRESPANADEEFDDLLNLDAPHVAMPSVLSRLALIALGAAAATFVLSFVLVATVPRGTAFDVLVIVTWLSVGVLTIGGFALLAAAGIAKVASSEDRG